MSKLILNDRKEIIIANGPRKGQTALVVKLATDNLLSEAVATKTFFNEGKIAAWNALEIGKPIGMTGKIQRVPCKPFTFTVGDEERIVSHRIIVVMSGETVEEAMLNSNVTPPDAVVAPVAKAEAELSA